MKAPWFLSVITVLAMALAFVMGSVPFPEPQSQRNAQFVKDLMLTDLSIWTEARYTRHPSQADIFTAFQDGPGSLEHFPAVTWVSSPDFVPQTFLPPGEQQVNGGTR